MPNTLTWNGHSNFRLACEGVAIIIDPFFEGNPTAPISSAQAGPADIVCLTHDHDDHVGSALDICLATGATLVAMYDIGRTLRITSYNVCYTKLLRGISSPAHARLRVITSYSIHYTKLYES